jgi:serine/threonine protein kinase
MPASYESEFPEPDPMTVDSANLGSVDPQSVEGLFLVALSKTGTERDAFLNTQCADSSQRQRVEALLVAYEQAGDFLQKPAVVQEPIPIGQYLAPCELPGTLGRLGPYEILEEIGRGGMGVVFRAHDPKLQRIVAVKTLAPELARLPSARQRFLREARAAAAISHPHVVTIFAVEGTEEASLGTERTTLPYLVMECVVGQTLHDKIKRVGALKVEEIVRISRQIAEGLAAAHQRGLIHRDIKPANILLENGVERVKITDFGLARTTSDGGITHTGEILGTPQCMSPEQARGEIVDQRSDLFSLGCVMYTMCTGFSPFRADNMLAVMKKVCEETPSSVAQLNAGIPEWLCSLVHALLEKLPESRIQSAEEVVQCLESQAAVASRSVPAKAPAVVTSATELPSAVGDPFAQLQQVFWSVGIVSASVGWIVGKDQYNDWAILPVAMALIWGTLLAVRKTMASHWTWIRWKSFSVSMLSVLVAAFLRRWDTSVGHRKGGVELFAENLFEAAVYILPTMLGCYWLTRFSALHAAGLEPKNLKGEGTNDGSGDPTQSPRVAPAIGFGFTTKSLVLVALFTGGIAAHQAFSRSGSQQNAALAMLFLLIALMLWLLIQFGAIVVRRTRALDAVRASVLATPQAARRAITPWIFLEWIIVGTLGVAIMASLGFATVLIMPYLPTPDEIGPRAYCVIRTPVAENVKYVTIDGKRATLEPGGPGEWRTTTTQGIREIYVAYDSDSVLSQERFFTTTANVGPGLTTIITAEPVMVRSLTRPPGIEAPTSVQTGRLRIPTAIPSDQTSTGLPINHVAISTDVTASIPLADAVEILTERASTPVASYSARDEVWIDEPGLIVRMRRESFEGLEDEQLEYGSNVAWGEGQFIRPKDTAVVTDIPAGRYQVLVQDLDYGWPLDRRGTITIGNELTVVHVKRSFQTHRLQSSGADRFPMSFRWAGKSYQIDTPDDVQIVNGLLSATAEKQNYVTPESFRTHPLFIEAVNIDTQGGGHSLRHHRTLAQIDIQSSDMLAGFRSPQGVLAWNLKCVASERVFVPTQGLEMFVTDRLIGWGSYGWDDNRPITMDESLAMPLVARRDSAFIRRFADVWPENNNSVNVFFHWFENHSDIRRKSVPAVRRLLAAWADGQPEVPESELLQLGEASSWEGLWAYSPKGSEALSEPTFVIAGSDPGTWRMKEPPEGAIAK